MLSLCIKTYTGSGVGSSQSLIKTVMIVIIIITGFYHIVSLGWTTQQVTLDEAGHGVTVSQGGRRCYHAEGQTSTERDSRDCNCTILPCSPPALRNYKQ